MLEQFRGIAPKQGLEDEGFGGISFGDADLKDFDEGPELRQSYW